MDNSQQMMIKSTINDLRMQGKSDAEIKKLLNDKNQLVAMLKKVGRFDEGHYYSAHRLTEFFTGEACHFECSGAEVTTKAKHITGYIGVDDAELELFSVGKGAQGQGFTRPLTARETNLESNGIIPKNKDFIVREVGIFFDFSKIFEGKYDFVSNDDNLLDKKVPAFAIAEPSTNATLFTDLLATNHAYIKAITSRFSEVMLEYLSTFNLRLEKTGFTRDLGHIRFYPEGNGFYGVPVSSVQLGSPDLNARRELVTPIPLRGGEHFKMLMKRDTTIVENDISGIGVNGEAKKMPFTITDKSLNFPLDELEAIIPACTEQSEYDFKVFLELFLNVDVFVHLYGDYKIGMTE